MRGFLTETIRSCRIRSRAVTLTAMKRRRCATGIALWFVLSLGACSSDSSPRTAGEDSPGISAQSLDAAAVPPASTTSTTAVTASTTRAATSTTGRVTSPDLEVTVPDEEPEVAGFTVVEVGSGPTVRDGDRILAAWEMASASTGEIVESTASDLGGPVEIEVGAGMVPAVLDGAFTGQTVGTRLEVLFPAGMADLPGYLDSSEAYALVVEIVDRVPSAAPGTTRPTTTAPATSSTIGQAPADTSVFVVADGPLSITPPVDSPLPGQNTFTVIALGTGEPVAEGDRVELDYIFVSWVNGQVVRSTAEDFGGTHTVTLGNLEVPRNLENAIFRQPVGSRVQVILAPNLPDLPDGLSPSDAYIVAIDIVGVE